MLETVAGCCKTPPHTFVHLPVHRRSKQTAHFLSFPFISTQCGRSHLPLYVYSSSCDPRIPCHLDCNNPPCCRILLCSLFQVRLFPQSLLDRRKHKWLYHIWNLGLLLSSSKRYYLLQALHRLSTWSVPFTTSIHTLVISTQDINALVGNDLPIEIPTVVVKWITYALFLHVVALILAAGSALFGLLAHVREFSMTCCSTFISGFAAIVAMVAFIFDIALFFIAKARINAVEGGAATIGSGVWLTLAAWLLLFFAGCFYGFGRCCISRRPRDLERRRDKPTVDDGYAESMRLDAVKAEADRKARQKQGEIGLPAFQEYEQTQPLTKHDPEDYVEDGDHIVPLSSLRNASNAGPATYTRQGTSRQGSQTAGGYAQAPAGTRAVDDYYDGSSQTNAYPPRRQMSAHTMDSSTVSSYSYRPPVASPPIPTLPPAPTGPSAGSQFLAVGTQPGHSSQFPSAASQNVGHLAGGTSCEFFSPLLLCNPNSLDVLTLFFCIARSLCCATSTIRFQLFTVP